MLGHWCDQKTIFKLLTDVLMCTEQYFLAIYSTHLYFYLKSYTFKNLYNTGL